MADEEIILGCYYELVEAVILNACFEDYFRMAHDRVKRVSRRVSTTLALQFDNRYKTVHNFADSEIIDLFCQSSNEMDRCKIVKAIRDKNQANYEKALCKLKLL